jgi:hypothetical protein
MKTNTGTLSRLEFCYLDVAHYLALPNEKLTRLFRGICEICESVNVIGRCDEDRGMQQNFASENIF